MRATRAAGKQRSRGVTLIELAVVIALVGIVGAIIVNFVAPVRSYIDVSRRAALTDAADTALRRIGRDLRLALPNSARVGGGNRFIEFLLVRTGGRYRSEGDPAATNICSGGYSEDALQFVATDNCFKTIGNIPNIGDVKTSDYVVVFNLQPGTLLADAYQTCGIACNKSQISAATAFPGEDRIEFADNRFIFESPGNRFFIIEGPVSYGCDPGAGTLTRYWGYSITASQDAPPVGGSSALLATNVADCVFTYDTSVTSQGAGLVTMRLRLSMKDSGGGTENVDLYHAVHVSNVP